MNPYNGFSPQQRLRALAWINRKYSLGLRQRPVECDACGQREGIIDAHSEDYSEPHGDHIGAYSFCYTCHMMIHCRFKAPAAWAIYRDAVAEGATFPPLATRNFFAIKRYYLGEAALPTPRMRPAPARKVLHEIEAGLGLRQPP